MAKARAAKTLLRDLRGGGGCVGPFRPQSERGPVTPPRPGNGWVLGNRAVERGRHRLRRAPKRLMRDAEAGPRPPPQESTHFQGSYLCADPYQQDQIRRAVAREVR